MTILMLLILGAPFYSDKANLMEVRSESGENRAVVNEEDWKIRRGHILENMQAVMGEVVDPAQVDFDVVYEESIRFEKFTRHKITFQVEAGDRLPAYLLIPHDVEEAVPGVLCLHPTNKDGKGMVVGMVDRPNRNYAEELAARGYVTLAPDYPGFGEYMIDVYGMGYESATAKGILNHRRCVDLLASLEEVDEERIGAIGHSLGGHNALYLAAFEPRVKAVVTSCGFNSFAKYKGGDLTGWSHKGYMPRIAEVYGKDPARMPFDFTEVLGVIAPRPLFISAPLHDANFEVSGVRDCVRAAEPVYELLGSPGNLRVVYPDCAHDFPPEIREQAYLFLDESLDGVDVSASVKRDN
ncbi:MAG: alpha/beta fold hydrolase [Candidatus Hydrogenedentota bacterium]